VLNDALAARGYLAGTSFTVADLNVAGILMWGKMARMDLSAYPELTRWLDACLSRPAYLRLRDQARRK
jgi:glutathione S-transferase